MYTVNGNVMKRSPNRLPDAPANREHPKDATFLHRTGQAVTNNGQRTFHNVTTGNLETYGRKGENVRTQRHSVCGLRDKMALSSAKVSRFVNANAHADRHMDAQTVCLTPPKARRRRSR